jgi:hypothetical protein
MSGYNYTKRSVHSLHKSAITSFSVIVTSHAESENFFEGIVTSQAESEHFF